MKVKVSSSFCRKALCTVVLRICKKNTRYSFTRNFWEKRSSEKCFYKEKWVYTCLWWHWYAVSPITRGIYSIKRRFIQIIIQSGQIMILRLICIFIILATTYTILHVYFELGKLRFVWSLVASPSFETKSSNSFELRGEWMIRETEITECLYQPHLFQGYPLRMTYANEWC